jgi:predicted ATPase
VTDIVGRDDELAALAEGVAGTLAGRGRLMLPRGEAGIGKSRLARHVLDLARDRGLTVLHGQAHPLHAGLAYAPIVEAVRPHVAALADHSGLARLLADPHAPPSEDADLERTRMFETMLELVDRLAPAVLFVDDLHWADRGTVELVHYVGQNVHDRQVLVLGAYRSSEAGAPLDDLAVTVRRGDPGGEISLTPLEDAAVAELTGNLLGGEPDQGFLAGVTQRAKGVPLFVTALVHQGFSATSTLPMIVRDVVLSRLHALGESERRLMEIVAVAGEAATEVVLTDMFHAPAALKNLIVGGLVTEHAAGRILAYRVAHPLYAEVAYAELTIGERRKLHAAVIGAIEKGSPGNVLALAPHYREAGDLVDRARAAEITAEAGWRALAMRVPDEAIRYLEIAAAQAEPPDVSALMDGIGRAYQSLSRFDEAAAAWRTAIALADQFGRHDVAAELRFKMAVLDAERYDFPAATEKVMSEAVVLNAQSLDVAVQHFMFILRHSDTARARSVTRILAAHAEGDDSVQAQAVGHLASVAQMLLDRQMPAAIPIIETALAYARQCDAEAPFYSHYTKLMASGVFMLYGDLPRSVELARELVAQKSMRDVPSMLCWERYVLAFGCYLIGDIAAAHREIDAGIAVARESGMPRLVARTLAVRAFLFAEQGRLTEARPPPPSPNSPVSHPIRT